MPNTVTVYSTSGSPQTNRPVSLGRPFVQGEISGSVGAYVGGTAITTQCNVKNRYSDDSVKFAILSFIVPTVAVGGTVVSFLESSGVPVAPTNLRIVQ